MNGKALESAKEVITDASGLAGELDGLEAGDDLFEHDLEGEPGEVDPEAIVLAESEAEVSVRSTGDVVAERLGELGVIPIGRGREDDDAVAFAEVRRRG